MLFIRSHDILNLESMKKHIITITILFLIIALGFFLRSHNISPFKIYPDSYQSLLIADNITNYHSVLGFLGPYGTTYPDYFSWTRSGYAFLIILVNLFTINQTLAAQIISFVAGIAGIVAVFFLLKTIFRSTFSGLVGAFLLAISFNHTLWSGFIMTETIGTLFLLLFLVSFFIQRKKRKSIIYPQDLLTGFLLSCAVLTRYEYIVVCVPLILFILFTDKKPLVRLMNIFIAFIVPISIVFVTLFPIKETFSVIREQLPDQLMRASLMLCIIIIGVCIPKKLWKNVLRKIQKYIPLVVLIFPVVFFIIPELLLFKKFVILDFVLSIFSIVGFSLLLRNKIYQSFGYFSLLACILLGVMYQNINSGMDRYITHLIPFLIVPATYGLAQTIELCKKTYKGILFLPLFLVICFQIFVSYYGLRYTNDLSWYRTSYEEKSAEHIKQFINRNDTILIAALPEPYYYSLHRSTYSVADRYPFIFIDNIYNKKTVIIVEDMALHNVFPNFTDFLHKNLQHYKQQHFLVNEKFRLKDTAKEEKYPIIIYRISLDELHKMIKKAYLHRIIP